MKKYLNFMVVSGFLGAVLATWAAPSVISLLFTPPVSFGTNCEPAGAWAMGSLVNSQLIGIVSGAILGLVLAYKISQTKTSKEKESVAIQAKS